MQSNKTMKHDSSQIWSADQISFRNGNADTDMNVENVTSEQLDTKSFTSAAGLTS